MIKTKEKKLSVAVKEGHFINSEGKEIPYKQSSQATYYFDCKGDGTSKGSFCCILEKGTEYFILTAGHNLQNKVGDGTTIKDIYGNFVQKGKKSPFYRLIKDTNNIVELELITDYRTAYDAAILKINKITENGAKVYDITDKNPDNNDIKKSTDFYGNAIRFNNIFFNRESDADGKSMEFVGYISKYKNNSNQKFKGKRKHQDSEIEPKDSVYYATTKIGDTGDSGGLMFNNSIVQGVYLGNNKVPIKNEKGEIVGYEESGICRTIDSLNFDKGYYIC